MSVPLDPQNPNVCPSCGASLSGDGLCPRCLMADAAQPTHPPRGEPPSLEEVTAAFPQFEIIELIGAGGMGTVWRARQPKLNRYVALKLLPASLAERDPAFAERFEREGQLLARLHHPNIVTVHDSGRAGNFFYLLMELVDGVNLRQAMRASRFTAQQALAIVPKICDALQYAHEEGVLHRDIKPENILLDVKGRVKLVDFGIAKLIGERTIQSHTSHASHESHSPDLTQSGVTLGTPTYMAPEQRDTPAEVDHRADIYSLGVVFYELLTGELPLGKFAPPSQRSAADPRLDSIVRQALEKERERRQHSVGEFRTQVEKASQVSGNPPLPAAEQNRPVANERPADPARLERIRWELFAYTALMAAGAIMMGIHLASQGVIVMAWGSLFFAAVVAITFISRGHLESIEATRQIALIDGSGICSAALGCAFLTPGLPKSWLFVIAAACAFGIVACVLQLANVRPFRSHVFRGVRWGKPRLGYAAYYCACLSSFILIWHFWLSAWLMPKVHVLPHSLPLSFAILSTCLLLGFAILAIVLGFAARKSWRGKTATIVGGVVIASSLLSAADAYASYLRARELPPLTQDETLNIQPDGTLRFKLIESRINRSKSSVDRESFRAYDLLHIEKMTDANGLPLRFEAAAGPQDLVHYQVTLNKPAAPGEAITTVSQGTLFGLIHPTSQPDVFEYHMDHFPGYEGITNRNELHRLPPGAELISKSSSWREIHVAGHIELRIEAMIPPRGNLDVRYRFRLPIGPAANPSAAWSPVIEREINLFDAEIPSVADGTFIQFKTGRVASTPKSILDEARRHLDDSRKQVDGGKNSGFGNPLWDWMRDEKLDAQAQLLRDSGVVIGVDFEGRMIARQIPNAQWNDITKIDIARELDKWSADDAGNSSMKASKFPTTFAFRTPEGESGVLQIVSFSEEKKTAKIRYKMAQSGYPDKIPPNLQSGGHQVAGRFEGGQRNVTTPTHGRYGVKLPNGVDVKVLAVAVAPRLTNHWRQPDGQALKEEPADRLQFDSELPADGPKPENEVALLVHYTWGKYEEQPDSWPNGDGPVYTTGFFPWASSAGGAFLFGNGKMLKDNAQLAAFTELPETMAYHTSVSIGPWERVAMLKGTETSMLVADASVTFAGEPSKDGPTTLAIRHNIDRENYHRRVIAHLKGGKTQYLSLSTPDTREAFITERVPSGLPADAEYIALERRRCYWAEISDIVLHPAPPK